MCSYHYELYLAWRTHLGNSTEQNIYKLFEFGHNIIGKTGVPREKTSGKEKNQQ